MTTDPIKDRFLADYPHPRGIPDRDHDRMAKRAWVRRTIVHREIMRELAARRRTRRLG